jgi:hypothetical protein
MGEHVQHFGLGAGVHHQQARQQRQHGNCDADPEQSRAGREQHHKRPEQIELFFDRERPEMWKAADLQAVGLRPVAQEGPQPDLVLMAGERAGAELQDARQDQQRHDQGQEIQREDPQRAPHVEGAQVVVAATRVQQVARDQETGQHEEQLHANPAGMREQRDRPQPGRRIRERVRVVGYDQQDGDAAQSIECGNMRASRDVRASRHDDPGAPSTTPAVVRDSSAR